MQRPISGMRSFRYLSILNLQPLIRATPSGLSATGASRPSPDLSEPPGQRESLPASALLAQGPVQSLEGDVKLRPERGTVDHVLLVVVLCVLARDGAHLARRRLAWRRVTGLAVARR